MAPPTRTPPETWIAAGLRALADAGPEAVRIEPLAKALGVTRGGFYWHFADRDALLAAMLDTWERTLVDQVIVELDRSGGDARTKLRRLFFGLAASSDLRDALRVEPAVRDWARRDAAVARRLRRVDNRRMTVLRDLFRDISVDDADAEARSVLVLSVFVANPFIKPDHAGRSRRAVVELALERLLA